MTTYTFARKLLTRPSPVLFIMLYKVVLNFQSTDKILSVTVNSPTMLGLFCSTAYSDKSLVCLSKMLLKAWVMLKPSKPTKNRNRKRNFLVKLSGLSLAGGNCWNSLPTSSSTFSFDRSSISPKTALAPQAQEKMMKTKSTKYSPELQSVPL